ncbi:MAG: stage III sporulation protein AA, partial [Lachnospiraceae bacterium]|nr:stage III sporulation protein AA [Lachnospiraceae bacterium]
ISMRTYFHNVLENIAHIQQIRMRVNRPVIVEKDRVEYFLGRQGDFLLEETRAWRISGEEMEQLINSVCGYSPYAFYEELKKGYITIAGGHRIGVAGQVITEGEQIAGIKNIRFLNIRISHEVPGAADRLVPLLYENGQLLNTLLISPPGYGKTTMLRDLIRQISDGNRYAKGMSVGVVDERSEIAGCYMGIPQNDVGIRTDVLDGCPKQFGMMMLIRSMAPLVVAIDELGCPEDVEQLKRVVHCGCRILVTMHGQSLDEIQSKPFARELVRDKYFRRYVILKGVAQGRQSFRLLDEEGRLCLR